MKGLRLSGQWRAWTQDDIPRAREAGSGPSPQLLCPCRGAAVRRAPLPVGGALACRGRRAASQGASARPVGEAGEPTRGQAAHTPDAAQALAWKLDWCGGRPAPPSRSGEAAGCHGRLSLVTKCSRHFPRCVSPAPIAEGVTGPGSLPHCREHPLCPCTDLRPAHCWPEVCLTGIFVTAEILLKEDKALKKTKQNNHKGQAL